MTHFVPVSREVMPYAEILGPISAITAAFRAKGVRFAIEGKAGLLIELYTKTGFSDNSVLHEMLAGQTPISDMVIDICVHPSSLRELREIYPDITLEPDEQYKPIVREGRALRWSRMAHGGTPDVFPVRLHLRHGGPDTILRTLYGPRTATHGIHVPIRSAADHLFEYCAAIVEADPLAPKHKFEGILDKQAIHLMGLILRIAAASFPHEDYQKFAQELIDIIGWPEFALWAAKEDLNAGHHGTETQVEDAWFKYCDFLEHFLKDSTSSMSHRNLDQ